ncbi:MAG: low molecular weight phosphotyrosine protein phosphatase [Clostridia bacterium]|nr:low molecular weight phosphotyrosine protein phosphatase [Clostridia bacterium]
MKVLIVCHGNICRSPMGEMMLKQKVKERNLSGFFIDSAAGSSEELGNSIYPPARRTLERHGVPYTDHRARKMTKADYEAFDVILVMDEENVRLLRRIVEDKGNKVRKLLSYTKRGGDVADPWYTGDFEVTYRDLDEGLDAFLDEWEREHGRKV